MGDCWKVRFWLGGSGLGHLRGSWNEEDAWFAVVLVDCVV